MDQDPSRIVSTGHESQGLPSRRRLLTLAAGAVAGMALNAACSVEPTPNPASPTEAAPQPDNGSVPAELDAQKEQDVLGSGNWSFFTGSRYDDGHLRIRHTGRAIPTNGTDGRPADKPTFVPHLPENLYGSYAAMPNEGNVGFKAQVSELKGAATLSFLSAPSIRRDESITRQSGVDITIKGAMATVSVWDGKDSEPSAQHQLPLSEASSTAEITVAQTTDLHVMINGRELRVPGQPLNRKEVWFGADASDSWSLDGLKAYPATGNDVSLVDTAKQFPGIKQSPDGLYGLARQHGKGDKLIGTAVDLAELMANPNMTEYIIQNFNAITTETIGKLNRWQPEKGQYEFAELDALVQFAHEHNLAVHGHCLVFAEAVPQWLHDELASPNSDKEALFRQTIEPIVSRYNGQNGYGFIGSWDVVNEPFDPDDWAKLNAQNPWYKVFGKNYIPEALQITKAASPRSLVGFNDWSIESDEDRRNAAKDLVRWIKSVGAPLDFVGLQCHFDEETLADKYVLADLRNGVIEDFFSFLKSQGVQGRISEASVARNGNDATQSFVYACLTRAGMSDNCMGISLWGAANSKFRNAYFTGNGQNDPGDDAPVVQDTEGKITERPAVAAMRAAITA